MTTIAVALVHRLAMAISFKRNFILTATFPFFCLNPKLMMCSPNNGGTFMPFVQSITLTSAHYKTFLFYFASCYLIGQFPTLLIIMISGAASNFLILLSRSTSLTELGASSSERFFFTRFSSVGDC